MKKILVISAKYFFFPILFSVFFCTHALANELDLDVGVTISQSRKYLEFWVKNFEEFDVACKWIKQTVIYKDETTGEQFAKRDVSMRKIIIKAGSFLRELEGGKEFIDAWASENRFAIISTMDSKIKKSCRKATVGDDDQLGLLKNTGMCFSKITREHIYRTYQKGTTGGKFHGEIKFTELFNCNGKTCFKGYYRIDGWVKDHNAPFETQGVETSGHFVNGFIHIIEHRSRWSGNYKDIHIRGTCYEDKMRGLLTDEEGRETTYRIFY